MTRLILQREQVRRLLRGNADATALIKAKRQAVTGEQVKLGLGTAQSRTYDRAWSLLWDAEVYLRKVGLELADEFLALEHAIQQDQAVQF